MVEFVQIHHLKTVVTNYQFFLKYQQWFTSWFGVIYWHAQCPYWVTPNRKLHPRRSVYKLTGCLLAQFMPKGRWNLFEYVDYFP